jgi:hypothetical protein
LKRYKRMMAVWEQYVPTIRNWDRNTQHSYSNRWQSEQEDSRKKNPYDIETLQDFATDVAYGIDGGYSDPIACVNTVVTYMKDFSGGLKDAGHQELGSKLTGSSRNVTDSHTFKYYQNANWLQFIQGPLLENLKMARRKRERRYGTMFHFIHLGTQLWKYD